MTPEICPAQSKSKPSLRAAINAKCKDCTYDPLSGGGTWREQVAQCSSVNCPLWPVRPAPISGLFANPCRDPEVVPQEWLKLPAGLAVSPHPSDEHPQGNSRV